MGRREENLDTKPRKSVKIIKNMMLAPFCLLLNVDEFYYTTHFSPFIIHFSLSLTLDVQLSTIDVEGWPTPIALASKERSNTTFFFPLSSYNEENLLY